MEPLRSRRRAVARFHLDRSIRIGEILTLITISVSVVALYRSGLKDRELRVREQATRVREAAGITLAKVDRLQLLSVAVFDDLQPLFVDVSNGFGQNRSFEQARDQFWRGVNDIKSNHQRRVRDEAIETGYVALVGFNSEIRPLFRRALQRRAELEDAMFDSLLIEGEQLIFSFEEKDSYASAEMGNAFREMATRSRKEYEPALAATLEPLQSVLLALLKKPEADIAAGPE